MTGMIQKLTVEQQKMLDEAALTIINIKRDTQAKIAASNNGAISDDGGFGSPCEVRGCNCNDFMGENLLCGNDSCRHSCSFHVFT